MTTPSFVVTGAKRCRRVVGDVALADDAPDVGRSVG